MTDAPQAAGPPAAPDEAGAAARADAVPGTPRQGRPARARTFACPNCGGTIQVRAAGISISAACASCGSVVDVANEDLRVIGEARQRTRMPAIPIGTRGDLVGVTWEAVGYQARSNPAEGWSWEEYLLFNPYYGFRFLARDDASDGGGWTLYCMLRQDVPDPAAGIGDGKRYAEESTGTARTDYVLGEFYWRVRVGDTVKVTEYAAAPYKLSREEGGQEVTWSRGVRLPDGAVEAAFRLAPPASGATAGDPGGVRTWDVVRTGALAVFLLLLLYSVPFGRHSAEAVFSRSFEVTTVDKGRTVVSDPFTIPGGIGNVRIDLTSPVTNNWIELAVSLVNEPADGKPGGEHSFSAVREISYYTGRDSDGTWSEGSRDATVFFGSVPGGEYRLLVDADASTLRASPLLTPRGLRPGGTASFTVSVTRNVTAPEFFWFALAALTAHPGWRVMAAAWRRMKATNRK